MKAILHFVRCLREWLFAVFGHLHDNHGEWTPSPPSQVVETMTLPSGTRKGSTIVTVMRTYGKESRKELLSSLADYAARQVLTYRQDRDTMKVSDQKLCPVQEEEKK